MWKTSFTLDAVKWCSDQHINVVVVNFDGEIEQVLTCDDNANAKLRRAQYLTDKAIAYQIVRAKIIEQYSLLMSRSIGEKPTQERAIEIFEDSLKWLALPDLPRWKDTAYIMTFEGRLADAYWTTFEAVTLKWDKSALRVIPPHWRAIGKRSSDLSKGHGARKATNPYHALTNYAYAMLESKVRIALVKQGFDLSCSFLHSDKQGRDSLVFDLIELYRSKIDVLVLSFIEKNTFKRGDFLPVNDGSVRLSQGLAKYIALSCTLSQSDIDEGAKWLKGLIME